MTAKTIAITSQKGGVGKTTLTLHLAAQLATEGLRVKVIALDPQSSALDWSVARDAAELDPLFDLDPWPRATIHRHLAAKSEGFDVVLLDVPPRTDAIARSALAQVDLAIIPIIAGGFDLWAVEHTCTLIDELRVVREEMDAVFLTNFSDKRTAAERGLASALADYDIDLLDTRISHRIGFRYAVGRGQVLQEYEPGNAGVREIRQLTRELAARQGGWS